MPARWISAQAAEVLDHQRVRAVKLGALGDAANVRAVARILALRPDLPLVLDVPLRATRGRGSLLARDAVATLRRELLPRANLVTVNTLEAEALTGVPVASAADARGAARALVAAGAQAALVKGGHLEGARATDVLAVGQQVLELHARRLPGPGAHGTGCTLASLVAGRLALRDGAGLSAATLVEAVRWAKRAHHAALSRATAVGGAQDVLVF
jgi:hydroxymethylpyrimidine/phosphomethylpyrimidine kinase